jgi:Tc5 transposase DNA-binding domain
LATQAIRKDPTLRPRVAARIFSIDHRKLGRRLSGIHPRRDIPANSRKLTDLEESVLVQHILDLVAKGFPPRMSVVEDMANRLLATRDTLRVGTRWASNFVKRRLELRTRFQRKYNYQRAKCKDPEVIRG